MAIDKPKSISNAADLFARVTGPAQPSVGGESLQQHAHRFADKYWDDWFARTQGAGKHTLCRDIGPLRLREPIAGKTGTSKQESVAQQQSVHMTFKFARED